MRILLDTHIALRAVTGSRRLTRKARELGATFDDLLLLNPRLAVAPSVPANTGVRYYG